MLVLVHIPQIAGVNFVIEERDRRSFTDSALFTRNYFPEKSRTRSACVYSTVYMRGD